MATSKIYQLIYKCNKDLVLYPQDSDYFRRFFIGERMPDEWPYPEIEIGGKHRPVRDFVSLMLQVPIITEKAERILRTSIEKHCQILKYLRIKNKQLYALNIITILEDFPKKFEETPNIFKLRKDLGIVYVNQKFADLVISNKLYGAGFVDPSPRIDGYYLISPDLKDLDKFFIPEK